MQQEENNFTCPINCPVRTELQTILDQQEVNKVQDRAASKAYYVDKGFSYINAFVCLTFYFVAAVDYHKTGEPVPLHFTILVFGIIAACLGIKTQGTAEMLGKFLSKKD